MKETLCISKTGERGCERGRREKKKKKRGEGGGRRGMLCRATQDGHVTVERQDRVWSIGEGNGKTLQYSCLEHPMNSMKRQNDRILKEELPRLVGTQYATRDQWKINSRKNEGMKSKQKQ